MRFWEFGILAVIVVAINLGLLALAVWLVVKVLQYMGVL